MALLHRFSKLNDRCNTGIFTFIVTRSVTRDLHRDATTKDFYYGYHRWAISFTRANDKVLGVYLILRDTSPSTITYTDYSITLLNREHFSRNEQYGEKQCKFSSDHPAHGINKWIPLSDIQSRNFGDETGEFLLELSLSNLMTVFETNICLQSVTGTGNNQANNQNNNSSTGSSPGTVTFKNGKLETSYFHFATFEWNISIMLHNANSGGPASMVRGLFKDTSNHEQDMFGGKSNRSYLIFLNRLTGFENQCRIQYRIVLGQDQLREDTGMIEQLSDMNGRSRGYQIDQHTFQQLTTMGMVNLYFEFYSCNPISEAKVSITRSISPTINCYDRNKQGWSIESDMEGEHLKLKLYFMDMHSVPRNHLRYVSWFVYVIVQDPHSGTQENIMVKNSPHCNYYIQDGIDMGVVMETNIAVADIKTATKKYLENETNLTVHIEWYDSIMLFNHIYHKYDDIARTHCHQMRREIAALTSENDSLERQIFAYQRSISLANNQMNAATNSMARLNIVLSPSKPTPPNNLMGFVNSNASATGTIGTAPATPSHSTAYRTQLDSSPYYNAANDDSLQTNSVNETANSYATERSATPVPSSPMQPHLSAGSIAAAIAQQQQLSNYLSTNLEGTSGPISTRHSFSGPTTPAHHQYHHHHHHQTAQQPLHHHHQSHHGISGTYAPQSYHSSLLHHHQLPSIPTNNTLGYSTSYTLRSPSSNPNIAQMYREDAAGSPGSTGLMAAAAVDGSVDDAYQTYSSRYKMTV